MAELNCDDIMLEGASKRVAVRVVASKTDVQGKGMIFRWAGTCHHDSTDRHPIGALTRMLCVYHVFLDVAVNTATQSKILFLAAARSRALHSTVLPLPCFPYIWISNGRDDMSMSSPPPLPCTSTVSVIYLLVDNILHRLL